MSNAAGFKGPSLCKTCTHRFRRVFVPTELQDYVDDEGNPVFKDNQTIVVLNWCIPGGIDVNDEITLDCNHYRSINEDINKHPFFTRI